MEEGKDQDSDDDGGGWITPSNIKQIQQELERCSVPKDVRVGCVTTDFAMQVGGRAFAMYRTCHAGTGPSEVWGCVQSCCVHSFFS